MPTVDEASAFARELIELEYVAEISRNSETDDAFTPKLIKLNLLFAHEITVASGISRPGQMTREELSGYTRNVADTRRRELVAVLSFRSSTRGTVFACQVTGKYVYSVGEPDRVWWVGETNDGWRVLGYDQKCYECEGAGKFGDRPCRDCNGAGWRRAGGVDLGKLERM
jgi:hypothetical protein